jgi:hypothetical protein
VQDALPMLQQAPRGVLADLDNRITLMHHSFFDDQPVSGASAYLIRNVTHNWSDEDCVRIFKAFVPALEKSDPGTPVLINDIVLPDLNEMPHFLEQRLRQVDVMMMVAFGGKQRTKGEFQVILEGADPRYRVSA